MRSIKELAHLKSVDLFSGVQLEALNKYQDYFQEFVFDRKETILSPGKFDRSILLVVEGKIRIYLAYPQGKEFTLTILHPGDVYSGHTRAFGQALDKVRLITIPIEIFKEILSSMPNLVFNLVAVLGDALKGSMDVIEGLVFEEAGMRFTSLLAEWSRNSGVRTDDGIVIDLNLTREEIASMIGTSRQTLATIIKELTSKKLIQLASKKIIIKDISIVSNYYK
ncbi:Crp/Fnr family transcriptional regulator [Desulforamulus aeronauticus]|uniref:Crp/Fnr family transcriptional regulator n=1 Tax=Desulforamulus aeronauticus TaxID=53343 RepID=UPI001EE409EE|nr:Crp/Fnr family transcriptional regulator [Desulforamulus aeronauticus]